MIKIITLEDGAGEELFCIGKKEATQLYNYIKRQYISHEDYPEVHKIVIKLSNFVFDEEERIK